MPIFSGFPCLNDVSCFYEQYEKYSNCEGKEFELALKQCNDYILNPEDDMATSSLDSCSMATCVETLKPVDQSFESTICTEKKTKKKKKKNAAKNSAVWKNSTKNVMNVHNGSKSMKHKMRKSRT